MRYYSSVVMAMKKKRPVKHKPSTITHKRPSSEKNVPLQKKEVVVQHVPAPAKKKISPQAIYFIVLMIVLLTTVFLGYKHYTIGEIKVFAIPFYVSIGVSLLLIIIGVLRAIKKTHAVEKKPVSSSLTFLFFFLCVGIAAIALFMAIFLLFIFALIFAIIAFFMMRKGKKTVEQKKIIPLIKDLGKGHVDKKKYETEIDVLYRLVQEKGRIQLSAVARYFNVEKKMVEDWATILEEHGLIKIHYPAFGEPELIKWQP